MYKTAITVHKIYSSPEHNYFTKEKFVQGDAPTLTHQSIKLVPNQGIKDDRFEFAKYPITFLSLEVATEVCKELELPLQLELFRRNIVISGVHLNSLIKKQFIIDGIVFEGLAHCAPCTWMNHVLKKGAFSLMSGRGGLRAKVIDGGELFLGDAILQTEFEIDTNPLVPLKKPSIPKNQL